MTDTVNHPKHYTDSTMEYVPAECIHITRHLPFSMGNAIKYIWRAGKKGDIVKAVEDLCKAAWYVDDCCNLGNLDGEMGIALNVFSLLKKPLRQDRLEYERHSAIWYLFRNFTADTKLHILWMLEELLSEVHETITQEERNTIRGMLKGSKALEDDLTRRIEGITCPLLKELLNDQDS
jgi:hypothetical protein